LKRIILISALCALSLQAFARNGIYIGEEIGLSWQTGLPTVKASGANSQTRDSLFNALRINLGYTHHLQNFQTISFGEEAAWGWYGDNTYTYPQNGFSHISNTTLEFLFVTGLHYRPSHLYFKIGALRQSINIDGINHAHENTVISPEAGLSYGYDLSAHWLATASYYKIFERKADSFAGYSTNKCNPGINAFTIGTVFRF
jgi:hypothetical protein